MKKIKILVIGIVLGAISWAVCPMVSDKFEPFDTDTGLILGQLILSATTVYIGYAYGFKKVIIAILGIYLGQNIYAYTFGGSESKVWFPLGVFTTIFLCLIPLIFGLLGKTIKMIVAKIKKSDGSIHRT